MKTIREARRSAGFSRWRMAGLLDMNPQKYRLCEEKPGEFPFDKLVAFCYFTNTNIGDFFTQKGIQT